MAVLLVLVLLLAFPFWIVDATADQDQDLAGCKLEALRTYPTPPPDSSRPRQQVQPLRSFSGRVGTQNFEMQEQLTQVPSSGYSNDSSGVGRMLLERQQLQQARDEYVNLCMRAKGYKSK